MSIPRQIARAPGLLVVLSLASCDDNIAGAGPSAGEPATTTIASIQGNGARSPLVGDTVHVEGVVTGDFQDNDDERHSRLGGFFIQSEQPATGNASTGLFVYDGRNSLPDVRPGDRVLVTGVVQEHFGETQLLASSLQRTGSGRIEPLELEMPFARLGSNSDGETLADLEAHEGMLVRLPAPLFVTDLRNLERFGTVRLSEGGRLFQFTNGQRPDAAAYERHREQVARRSIILDDGRRDENATPVRYLDRGDTARSLRTGDAVTAVTGNLRYSRGSGGRGDEGWRIMPVDEPRFEVRNPRPGAPARTAALRVASANLLNLFAAIDTGANRCGPGQNRGCRGADSNAERERQLAKTVTALTLADADIVGLMELENGPREAALQALVAALNARSDERRYAWLATGLVGRDTIRTGFIYRPDRVRPVGNHAVLDSREDPRFNDDRNRPALAQTFAHVDGGTLTIIVNHLKSKGSDCEAEGDPNTGDGQGNCNLIRTRAAQALVDWVASGPTGSSDPDVLIIGDLNAYLSEDPLEAFRSAGLVNLVESAPGTQAYSFVFDGQAGALDHAIATPGLAAQVVGTIEWHINADEPPLLDYNLAHGRDPALFDPDSPYRASDHDPIIVDIDLAP